MQQNIEGVEPVRLTSPDFEKFTQYILKDCASTPWDSYMRRVYRLLGFPEDMSIPPAPVSRFGKYGMSPGMWHKAALAAGSYSVALESLGVADAFNVDAGVEALKELSAAAHSHPLAPVFTHGVRKFTAEQQATLNLMVSPHMQKLVETVGISALLGFLPAVDFMDGYDYADLARLIEAGGIESVVPLKPSQVADSPLGRVLAGAFDRMDSVLAEMLSMPETVARAGWLLTHDSGEWSSLDAPIAVRKVLPDSELAEAPVGAHFVDMALF